ncbi:Apolipoprotein N-acyltransferase [Rubripirellula obstinata]|uniref:Apolipoprotein N-acyltransferase n=2 Tax=Rubripirellula obstinata TaxID=406547 RepID=A0A5B1CCG6_9BACT|nr:Apolipoprotein N-acyltransferase [Rubripirellula obstinata]
MDPNGGDVIPHRQVALHCAASVVLLWMAGPPTQWWPLALVAIVPWLKLILMTGRLDRRGKWIIVAVSTLYWMVSLQGLRHAHPAIYVGWFALSAYLAVYHLLFIWLARRLIERKIGLQIAAPLAWMTTELVRNYLLSGISVLMLGHAMADVPAMIQIADLVGTYGVGWVVMVVNVAVVCVFSFWKGKVDRKSAITAIGIAIVYVVATLGYASYRLAEPTGKELATFLLLQRNEEVDYLQSQERELEIFEAYAKQAVEAVKRSEQTIDAVVWPESMFSGGAAWMVAADDMVVPAEAEMPAAEFAASIKEQQAYIERRARYLGELMIEGGIENDIQEKPPAFIAGCGVISFGENPESYSGVLHVDSSGNVASWYGKMHLVMFGEYIPILPWIPGANSLMPPGMGLATGEQPGRMPVGDTLVSPNICIETAVERVTGAQVHWPGLPSPDVVVTVTNDGWFDDSSLIEHHLRCVQLVAVGVRRPILSSANNGPTAWVDDRGAIVDRLERGENGQVIAKPTQNTRTSFYARIGDWPMRLLGLLTIVLAFVPGQRFTSTKA